MTLKSTLTFDRLFVGYKNLTSESTFLRKIRKLKKNQRLKMTRIKFSTRTVDKISTNFRLQKFLISNRRRLSFQICYRVRNYISENYQKKFTTSRFKDTFCYFFSIIFSEILLKSYSVNTINDIKIRRKLVFRKVSEELFQVKLPCTIFPILIHIQQYL